MFFQLLSTIKVKLVDKKKQSTYLFVILHVKHKESPILAVLTGFLILDKSKMATMFEEIFSKYGNISDEDEIYFNGCQRVRHYGIKAN